MSSSFALLFLAATDPALIALMPCTPGLSIEYIVEPKEAGGKPAKMIETVRGTGREANTCVLDRVTVLADGRELRDAWARELLADRITNAGPIDQVVAFRPPILVAPIAVGTKWHFNTTRFQIAGAGETHETPAGKFAGCVRIVERSIDGKHEASSIYAPDVGLIAYEAKDHTARAVRVKTPPRGKNSPKTSR
jgi:hypothetical protein